MAVVTGDDDASAVEETARAFEALDRRRAPAEPPEPEPHQRTPWWAWILTGIVAAVLWTALGLMVASVVITVLHFPPWLAFAAGIGIGWGLRAWWEHRGT